MTESPSPDDEKPRDLSSKREAQPPTFGAVDPVQLESLRLLMNPSLNPALNSYFNPIALTTFQKNFAAAAAAAAQTPVTQKCTSSAPKRSKLMIDEILKLKPEPSEESASSTSSEGKKSSEAGDTQPDDEPELRMRKKEVCCEATTKVDAEGTIEKKGSSASPPL